MKKKIFAAVFAMAAVFGGYQNYASASSAGLSDMAKANVEALTSGAANGFRCCDDRIECTGPHCGKIILDDQIEEIHVYYKVYA